MQNVGQCPKCSADNPYTTLNCGMCGARLPWADVLSNVQQRASLSSAPGTVINKNLTQPIGISTGGPVPASNRSTPTVNTNKKAANIVLIAIGLGCGVTAFIALATIIVLTFMGSALREAEVKQGQETDTTNKPTTPTTQSSQQPNQSPGQVPQGPAASDQTFTNQQNGSVPNNSAFTPSNGENPSFEIKQYVENLLRVQTKVHEAEDRVFKSQPTSIDEVRIKTGEAEATIHQAMSDYDQVLAPAGFAEVDSLMRQGLWEDSLAMSDLQSYLTSQSDQDKQSARSHYVVAGGFFKGALEKASAKIKELRVQSAP